MNFNKKHGFTLIELLVVLAILGTLAAIVTVSFGNIRARGRDTKRKSDFDAIQKALDLYFDSQDPNEHYPQTVDLATDINTLKPTSGQVQDLQTAVTVTGFREGGLKVKDLLEPFIANKKLPNDPRYTPGATTPPLSLFKYLYVSNGREYILWATMENKGDPAYNGLGEKAGNEDGFGYKIVGS